MIHKKILSGGIFAAVLLLAAGCDIPEITWEHVVEDDGLVYSLQQTRDGGYIVGGEKDTDFWVMKFGSSGTVKWEQTYRTDNLGAGETLYSIRQTRDGGYIAAGLYRAVPDGDSFRSDIWVVKIDRNGVKEWDFMYDRGDADFTYAIQQTSDGGYVFAGGTRWDIEELVLTSWLVKLTPEGLLEWDRLYNDNGLALSGQQTADGGYVMAGGVVDPITYTASTLIRKLDPSGEPEWEQCYGSTEYDGVRSVFQTSDRGYIAAGQTGVTGGDTSDCWILKLDDLGNIEWSNAYGGAGSQYSTAVRQTRDGGYIIAGGTEPDPSEPYDYLLLKIDESGTEEWMRTFHYDEPTRGVAWDVWQTKDGGYITGGGKIILKLDSEGRL
ncbi:MAG: hypothetical protein JXA07_02940 [Spirochaetes bacterium]|nr:hypothetical protein [Spirochaetota bacterium]